MESAIDVIKGILDREDIEGLLSLGAPEDEYAPEARVLSHRLQEWTGEGLDPERQQTQVAEAIKEVWCGMFGPLSGDDLARREEAFNHAAAQIVAALRNVR